MFLCYFSFCHQILIEHLLYARCIIGSGDSMGYKTDNFDALMGTGLQIVSK